jgi:hypothetical protein
LHDGVGDTFVSLRLLERFVSKFMVRFHRSHRI